MHIVTIGMSLANTAIGDLLGEVVAPEIFISSRSKRMSAMLQTQAREAAG